MVFSRRRVLSLVLVSLGSLDPLSHVLSAHPAPTGQEAATAHLGTYYVHIDQEDGSLHEQGLFVFHENGTFETGTTKAGVIAEEGPYTQHPDGTRQVSFRERLVNEHDQVFAFVVVNARFTFQGPFLQGKGTGTLHLVNGTVLPPVATRLRGWRIEK